MEEKNIVVILVILIIVNLGLLAGVVFNRSTLQCEIKGYGADTRIIGGRKISINEHPFIAAIVIKKQANVDVDSLQCGCTIISSKWVVTAAHCLFLIFDQRFRKSTIYISSNSANWRKGKKHDVLDWVYHEDYDNSVMCNDIALIRVKQPFTASAEKTIPIANSKYVYKPDAYVMVAGWGLQRQGGMDPEQDLRGVEVKIFKQSLCQRLYGEGEDTVTKEMFCAGFLEGGKDACQFDSGGPIFHKGLLIGIVSWGVECAKRNQPGVYTRINLYQKWMTDQAKKFNDPIRAVFKSKP